MVAACKAETGVMPGGDKILKRIVNTATVSRTRVGNKKNQRFASLAPVDAIHPTKIQALIKHSFASTACEMFNDELCQPRPEDLVTLPSFVAFVRCLDFQSFEPPT